LIEEFSMRSLTCLGLLSTFLVLSSSTQAQQVIPDGTLNTVVTRTGNAFTITNGGAVGSNLFHSFREFSIPSTGSATFDLVNTPNVSTIFSRVTGGTASNIDGLIRTTNSANPVSLFLLNPGGILFGANARLDVGGSFIGTTANTVQFSDGAVFSAANPTALLTMSAPVGLQLGSNSGAIQAQGSGHNFAIIPVPGNSFPPFTRASNPQALSVRSGNTFALIGNGLSLDGAHIVAEQGRIELGSLEAGTVKLSANASGFAFDYSNIADLRDMQLSRKAGLDASGSVPSGGISLAGRNIRFLDGSVGLVQNLAASGAFPGSPIQVRSSGLLEFSGTTPDGKIRSHIITETNTEGTSGKINVATQSLRFREGGQIVTRTFGKGGSGNVTIEAKDSVEAIGSAPLNSRFLSGIFVSANGTASGDVGDLRISTQRFAASAGAIVSTASYSNSTGGDLFLNADTVDVLGVDPVFKGATDLRVGSFSGGNSGNLTINARQVSIREGGRLNGTTIGRGTAGTVMVNASELVDVNGGIISASATSAEVRSIINGYNPELEGRAGAVKINTDRLVVQSRGRITVQNNGPENAGILKIDAGSVVLQNQGSLSAATIQGEGGNLQLRASDFLLMRYGSSISAKAGGTGNGGNITIDAPIIVGLDNSDIIASAVRGRGGNILVTTQGILGLEYRPQLTPENDITASSEFGVNGTVEISTIGVDPNSGLVELSADLIDSSQQIAKACNSRRDSRFVVTGRGGIPDNPQERVIRDRTWSDLRDLSTLQHQTANSPNSSQPMLIEATNWTRDRSGKILLIAETATQARNADVTCASR
jgi:filamentous hemagglutinin family protein